MEEGLKSTVVVSGVEKNASYDNVGICYRKRFLDPTMTIALLVVVAVTLERFPTVVYLVVHVLGC